MKLDLFKGKKVFVTGHTGFKGSWLCRMLIMAGAEVTGYALKPYDGPNLFSIAGIENDMRSVIGDVRDLDSMRAAFEEAGPEIVLHLAAQPIVREGYRSPAYTYETNVMGTVNILECVRLSDSVRSFVNITTDKVYKNNEWEWGYRETDTLGGFDPYSNSKSCSELVTASYIDSFLSKKGTAVSVCRAGNVIGGGDFAADRIIPDCVRAMEAHREIIIRNPYSVRPYQHVLEPVTAYLTLAAAQYDDPSLAGSYNIGPDEPDCITTAELAELFCKFWGGGARVKYVPEENAVHEASFLKLDCSKIKKALSWNPRWHIGEAVEKTVEWSKAYLEGRDAAAEMDKHITEYLGEVK
ncbi:MAG: CDP-glucose 4,6-dehydratase [Oscillospiraceae bacterium]|nr:CDP-glucose 4,6-dehydratase [Oscillospiraceae bacterium]